MTNEFSKFCNSSGKWHMIPPSYMFANNKYPCHLLPAILMGYDGEGSPSYFFVQQIGDLGIPDENLVCYGEGTEREWFSFFGTKEQVAKVVVEMNKRLRKVL